MELNTISLDPSAGPQTSNAPRGGNDSFKIAYAKVLDENDALVGRADASLHSMREQNSVQPSDRAAHTVRAGETLYGIVRNRLSTAGMDANPRSVMQGVKQLAQTNDIRNPDRVYVGQKIDVTTLISSVSQHTTTQASNNIDRSAAVYSRVAQPQAWHTTQPAMEVGMQLADEDAMAQPLSMNTATATRVSDDAVVEANTESDIPLAARQIALYEQNAPAATAAATPVESPNAFSDIVYKGVVGKVLDAMPLDASTRTGLQRANSVVGSTFTGRSLGLLAGISAPLLAFAGLIWGIFASKHIDAAATAETKSISDAQPLDSATQLAKNKSPEACCGRMKIDQFMKVVPNEN